MSSGEGQFGPWLRRKLDERRLSLAQLCRTVGCDYTYLWRILHADTARGRRYTRPSYTLTRRVGEALGAPREALAAAGYDPPADLDEARVADRLEQLETDLATLRASLGPREVQQPADWRAVRIPLLGHIRAGELHEALENPDEWIELPDFVARDPEGFALRVRGESMEPTLLEGDIVTVKPQPSAEPGQVVVATVENEVTLKRYELVDGIPTLVPDNPDWQPARCGPRVRILGVVMGSFRTAEVLLRRPR